jgi:hypothetical protein
LRQPIDVVSLVSDLPSRPRGRACIVLTHDYLGQRDWAIQLAKLTGSKYVNLLETFANDEDLCGKIREFFVDDLFTMLENPDSEPVSIVSGIEFLKATWIGQEKATEEFGSQVETWDKEPCLVFVLQYDKKLATRKFIRFPQYSFVVDQNETIAL